MDLDEEFDKIAQEAIEAAGKVRCDAREYRNGLRHIINEVHVALAASQEMDG